MHMGRASATIPDDLADLIAGAVDAGVFENKSDAIREALREYFEGNEHARIAAAVQLYAAGEISLGTAARLADKDRFEMRDILLEHDVELRLGPTEMADARREIEAARGVYGDRESEEG